MWMHGGITQIGWTTHFVVKPVIPKYVLTQKGSTLWMTPWQDISSSGWILGMSIMCLLCWVQCEAAANAFVAWRWTDEEPACNRGLWHSLYRTVGREQGPLQGGAWLLCTSFYFAYEGLSFWAYCIYLVKLYWKIIWQTLGGFPWS